jgi:stalled ribosome rescue protein Dom34
MTTPHAAVWIDHNEAKVFHIADLEADGEVTTATLHPRHHLKRHPNTTAEHEHPADAAHFFRDVTKAVADADEILVVGPGKAKLELIKYVHKHEHTMEPKIVGVETVDHPTDRQLLAYVRSYFHAKDRMLGKSP